MLWSIASNAFCKSIRTIPVRTLDSKAFVILSWRYESVEWNFLKPDWNLYVTLFSDKRVIVWSWKIFFIVLEISGSCEIGLKFFRPKKKIVFKQFVLEGYFICNLSIKPLICNLSSIITVIFFEIILSIKPLFLLHSLYWATRTTPNQSEKNRTTRPCLTISPNLYVP